MNEFLGMAFRISIMYVFALAILRLSGKRSIHNLSPLDFVVATIIGDMFDDAIWSEISLAKTLVGITTIIGWHILVSVGVHYSQRIERLVAGSQTLIVKNSRMNEKGLKKERTPKEEAMAQLRLSGEEHLTEIKEAYWEPEGKISVLKKEADKAAQKQDLPRLEEIFK